MVRIGVPNYKTDIDVPANSGCYVRISLQRRDYVLLTEVEVYYELRSCGTNANAGSCDPLGNTAKGLYLVPDYDFDLLSEERTVDNKCTYNAKQIMHGDKYKALTETLGGSLKEYKNKDYGTAQYVFDCQPVPLPTPKETFRFQNYLYVYRDVADTWYQQHRVARDWVICYLRTIDWDSKKNKWVWSDGSALDFTNWRSDEPNNHRRNEDKMNLYTSSSRDNNPGAGKLPAVMKF
eukprot:8203193-Ditylum_brightwellii.AAC.2